MSGTVTGTGAQGSDKRDPLQQDGHKCVMCEMKMATKEELQEHFRLHANGQIDMKGRQTQKAVKPIVKQVTIKALYCPQSFSGGGLYSSGNGLLLWSVVGYFYEVWLQIWCKLVTLFDSYSCDGVSAGIWVIQTGPKSGGSW